MGYCFTHGYYSTTDGKCPGCKGMVTSQSVFLICTRCGFSYLADGTTVHVCPNAAAAAPTLIPHYENHPAAANP